VYQIPIAVLEYKIKLLNNFNKLMDKEEKGKAL